MVTTRPTFIVRLASRPVRLCLPPYAPGAFFHASVLPRRRGFIVAILLAAVAANAGCALAARGALGFGARAGIARGAVATGSAVRAGALVAGTRGAIGAAGISAEVAELMVFRNAAGSLFYPRALAGVGRAEIVLRGGIGRVVGVVETMGPNAVLVRSSQSRLAVRAIRNGRFVEYRVSGQAVGYSELVDGRIQHYVYERAGTQHIGYDLVTGGRVLQYDARGVLIGETSLQAAGYRGHPAALAAIGSVSAHEQEQKAKRQAIRDQAERVIAAIKKPGERE